VGAGEGVAKQVELSILPLQLPGMARTWPTVMRLGLEMLIQC
jgi:hypothetical protein